MPSAIGHTLQNRYHIQALLGQGGMGAVYRAQDTHLDILVAIKEMLPQTGLDPDALVRLRGQFLQEAKVLARLNHTHLVNVTDYFEEDEKAYLVMKFIEGESLADLIAREGALDETQVLIWAEQILDALAYCHTQHILHRDIKPQNIVIQPDGNAVLVDFGLVKLWDPADPRTRTTIRGAGTPEYAPPEQYSNYSGHTDPRSDIYSLGATLYHALSGQAPPSVTDRMAFPQQFKTPRELNSQISAETDRVIQRAIALPQETRWPSASEMIAALRDNEEISLPQSTKRVPTWLWGLGAVLVLGLLASFAMRVRLLSGDESPPTIVEMAENPTSETVTSGAPVTETTAPTHSASVGVTEEPVVATAVGKSTATTVPTVLSSASATATLAPTATPNATATPRCPTVQGPFAAVWAMEQDRLGCAQGSAFNGLIVEETFEGGKMFWREPIDSAQALVLFNDGTWRIFTHAPYVEGSPEFPCTDANTPAQCPPTPKRGFGAMWCDIPEIRNGLGNALDCERGYQGSLQRFDNGSALRTDTGGIYVFYANGSWDRK